MDDNKDKIGVLTDDESLEVLDSEISTNEEESPEEVEESQDESVKEKVEELETSYEADFSKEDDAENLDSASEKTDVLEEPKNEETLSNPEPVSSVASEEQVDKPTKKKSSIGIFFVIIIVLTALIALALFLPELLVKKNNDKGKTVVDNPVKESAYRITSNSLEDFDLYFLKLENEDGNIIYSPLSIKYVLAMLNEGTDGTSHDQIANIIGEYKAKKYNNNEHMSFANAIYIRNIFKDSIKEEYTNNLKEKYGAEVVVDDFKSADPINSWVSNRTFNLIDNLLDDDTVKDLNFVLINALAIDMNWKNRIQYAISPLPENVGQKYYDIHYAHEKVESEENSYYEVIYSIEYDRYPKMTFDGQEDTKSVEVGASFNRYDIVKELGEDNIRNTVTEKYNEYLAQDDSYSCADSVEEYVDSYMKALSENYKKEAVSTDFSIYVDEDFKVFAKDLQTYDGTTLQYVGIMPRKEKLSKYIKDTNAKDISKLLSQLKVVEYDSFKDGVVTRIRGNIPLFKYEYELDLIKDLYSLGVTDIFDITKSDLSKMLNNEKQIIDDARHKAVIEFSNDGIKAAAATSASGAGAAGCSFDYIYDVPVEDIDITFDKPYMYIIRDKDTGEVWFMGAVYQPEKVNY